MQDLVEKLSTMLKEKGMKMATAESCTGGLLAAAMTYRPGSSEVFDSGFVTYSNEAKTSLLKVPEQMITMNGAVSAQTAEAMARGAVNNPQANIAVSITGVAGPGGGSENKPVGLVYIGYAIEDGKKGSVECHFEGSREEIRAQAATTALQKLIEVLEEDA